MRSVSCSQLTLSIEPGVIDRWPTLREFIAHRVEVQPKLAKTIAGDMDMSPSALSRKLHPAEGDTARFNVDDLERYIASTGDVGAVIEYLATKYASGGDEGRRARALAQVERMIPELQGLLTMIKKEKG